MITGWDRAIAGRILYKRGARGHGRLYFDGSFWLLRHGGLQVLDHRLGCVTHDLQAGAHLLVEDCTVDGTKKPAIEIEGLKDAPHHDITFRNIKITNGAPWKITNAKNINFENVTQKETKKDKKDKKAKSSKQSAKTASAKAAK